MTIKALYWGLINHCEEKWKAWNAALIWMANSLIKMARMFNITPLPDIEYTVSTDHRYPITDDEEIECENDMQEVGQQLRSRKSYIQKWMPDIDANEELAQIVREARMLGDDFGQAVHTELETGTQL